MKPYSQDLRERVMTAVRAGRQSLDEIARTFGVSASTVDKWHKRWRETGSVAVRPFAAGRHRTLHPCDDWLRAEVKRQSDVSLDELCARVQTAWGVSASPSMMCRELQFLNLRVKKSRSTIVHVRRLA
jgi:transposase